MAFLSALATPLVRRFETWLPDAGAQRLLRARRLLRSRRHARRRPREDCVERGQGTLGRAFVTGVPAVSGERRQRARGRGRGAARPACSAVVAVPVLQRRRAEAVVAWYF